MRQAWYDKTGAAVDVLEVGDVEMPVPGKGEVLVRVRASGINPSDCKQRKGWPGREPAHRVIPHSDGAGVVEAAGSDGEDHLIGGRVWIWNARGGSFYGLGTATEAGTATEYTVVPASQVARLPDSASFEVGAALGGPGCTAHYLIFADGDVKGQTILIQGGAGAVGELAVAFARHGGARVVATVSSAEKAKIAEAAGAHHIIDYHKVNVVEAVRALCPDGVDRIVEVDFAANVADDATMIRQNGLIASYSSSSNPKPVLPYYALQFKGVTVRFLQGASLPPDARRRAIDGIEEGLEAGWLKPTIAELFPLDRIVEAHLKVESGTAVGNVVLTL